MNYSNPMASVRSSETIHVMAIGIVVVSLSRPLATAAVEFALALVTDARPQITIAAGLDATALGTDATEIAAAIGNADQGEGVVVLMDVEGAALSAELALEYLDAGVRQRTVLCPAPLIEGLIAAVVAASGGQSVGQVAAEACNALANKISRIEASEGREPSYVFAPDEVAGSFVVRNTYGLHVRPAAQFVKTATVLDTQVMIRNRSAGSAWVPANSLSKVTGLDIRQGDEIELRATGVEAIDAVHDLLALAAKNFGESAEEQATASPVEQSNCNDVSAG